MTTTKLLKNLREARPLNRERTREDWYRIENLASTNTARIFIYDEIGMWGITALDFVQALEGLKVDNIDLRVNSPGGDVFDGMAIYNALRNHPAHVTATVDGLAASAASFIVMAADEVVMEKTGTMMIHDGMSPFCSGNAAALRELADLLDKMSGTIASVYADRSGRPVDDIRALMQAETWFNAQEAVDAGLADRVAADKKDDGSEDDENDVNASGMAAKWDLSIFNFTSRDNAPAPVIPVTAPSALSAQVTPDLGAVIMNAIKEATR